MRAAIYRRISRDPEGERLGVERQREDLLAHALQRGYEVVAEYEDNDLSASTRSRRRRPQYDLLLEAARRGEFDVVIAYTSSRLTRRPRENEDLIELAERHGIKYEYLRSPSFDLNTADGRNVARILAANDAAESERISERVSRAAAERKAKGLPHGGHPQFGTTNPKHAEWVREAANRLLAGETLYGICSDWNRRGRKTQKGVVWRSRTLKRILLHTNLLPEETTGHVRSLLSDDGRQIRPWPGHTTVRKYPLIGLLRCGRCDHVLHSMTGSKGGPPAYFCSTQANGGCGKLRIAMHPLEEWILEQVLAVLDGLTVEEEPEDVTQANALRQSLLRDEHALEQVTADMYAGLLTRQEGLRHRQIVLDRIESTKQALADISRRSVRANLPAGHLVAEQWTTRDAIWKATILGAVIDHVVIQPFPSDLPFTLPRRKGESDGQLQERRQAHQVEVLRRRVSVTWRV